MQRTLTVTQQNDKSLEQFLTFYNEKLLLAKRKHWFILVVPLTSIFFLNVIIAIGILFFFTLVVRSSSLLISSVLLVSAYSAALSLKLIVDWYFHLYIVTTHKIIEAEFKPLSSETINDVLLNQVRCTEVDTRINGIISELVDLGDVIVTFDRPTQRAEFIFADIRNPREVGMYLGEVLAMITQEPSKAFWYRQKDRPENLKYTEEIYPKVSLGIN